jgi:hypothetical protein
MPLKTAVRARLGADATDVDVDVGVPVRGVTATDAADLVTGVDGHAGNDDANSVAVAVAMLVFVNVNVGVGVNVEENGRTGVHASEYCDE